MCIPEHWQVVQTDAWGGLVIVPPPHRHSHPYPWRRAALSTGPLSSRSPSHSGRYIKEPTSMNTVKPNHNTGVRRMRCAKSYKATWINIHPMQGYRLGMPPPADLDDSLRLAIYICSQLTDFTTNRVTIGVGKSSLTGSGRKVWKHVLVLLTA